MSKLKKITKYIRREAKRKSVYVWGAQGERLADVNYQWIVSMETNTNNVERIINFIIKWVGYISKYARCFDCSGLVVYYFLKYKIISSDMTADGLLHSWPEVQLSELKEGDLVYIESGGKATHVGYYTGENDIVVESRGRDYGVVETYLTSRPWSRANRPNYK